MKYLSFWFILFLPLFADSTFWKGKIGQHEAYMKLCFDPTNKKSDKRCRANYYFQTDKLVDVWLKDVQYTQNGSMEFHATWNKLSEQMRLKIEGETLEGVLRRGANQYLVTFKKVEEKSLQHMKIPFLRYTSVKKELLKRPDVIVEVEWIKEHYSQIVFPRLLSGFLTEKLKTINALLQTLHREKALHALSCSYGWSDESAQELITTIGYVSKTLFSLVYIDMQSCDNASQRRDVYGELYSVDTGQPYTLEHLVAFSKNTPIQKHTNEKQWREYREKYFAPKIRDFVFATKGWKVGGEEDKECDYSNINHWRDVTWFLGKKGLVIKPDYTGDLTGCRDAYDFILPLDLLKRYKNREYPHVLDDYIAYLEKIDKK